MNNFGSLNAQYMGKGVTNPVFFVAMSTIGLRLCSAGNYTLFSGSINEAAYVGAAMVYSGDTLRIFNEGGQYGSLFQAPGEIPCRISFTYTPPPWNSSTAISPIWAGVLAQRSITEWIVAELREKTSMAPNEFVNRTRFRYLPTRGTLVLTNNGIYEVRPT